MKAIASLPIDYTGEYVAQEWRRLFPDFVDSFNGAIIVDCDGRIEWVSERYLQLLSLKRESVIGKVVEELLPHSLMRRVIETGKPLFWDIMDHGKESYVVIHLPLRNKKKEVVGALGFVIFEDTQLLGPIISRNSQLRKDLVEARKKLGQQDAQYALSSFVGMSIPCQAIKQRARIAARTNAAVLICGETGTDKVLLAHAIHKLSSRAHKPFVAINVAAVSEPLLKAEIFGAGPGAYTGVERKGREGKFVLAQGGTLFLDEIGAMPLPLQRQLLRVLQGDEDEPVGSRPFMALDVRIIAATSHDLREDIKKGKFREDLYCQLNGFDLQVPPLRDRLADIPLLCEVLIENISQRSGGPSSMITPKALSRLAEYYWPGNVRELSNLLEHSLLIAANDKVLTEMDIRCAFTKQTESLAGDVREGGTRPSMALNRQVADAERSAICAALLVSNGKKIEAARFLGISRTSLSEKMLVLGIK